MNSTLKIVGIAGSLRKESLNRSLLSAAAENAPADVDLEILTLDDIPLYNGDVEAEGVPAAVRDLADTVAAADAVLLVTPEYNGGIPGVLKNAVDWLSRSSAGTPLRDKPVAIMGASPGRFGTSRAQEHLKLALLSLRADIFTHAGLALAGASSKFRDGRLIDEPTREFLATFMGQFSTWARRRPAPADAGRNHHRKAVSAV